MDDCKAQLPAVQQQQLKKLYFKPSTTEALHSAILLKARNNSQKPQPLCKVPTKIPLLSISSKQIENSDDFELETPFKIKENILSSIKNIKNGLDILRTSTSDDEDSHSDNIERKRQTDSDIIILDNIIKNVNRSGKRGKEEALSNSSSSDEEDLNNQKAQKQPALTINLKPISVKPRFNNMLSLNVSNTTISQAPPFITPVVSCSNSSTSLCFTSPSNYLNTNLEHELINSPSSLSTSSSCCSSSSSPYSGLSSASSVKSQKSCSDQDFSSSILSIGSPTSCCSSLTTNDGIIDLNDDNSSTASGPIYIRQPGFEHHAHEVVKQQDTNSTKMLNTLKNFVINNSSEKKINKIVSKKLNYSSSTGALPETFDSKTKVKKKLCIMNNECLTQIENTESPIQLKPISNRQKRDPLPMRLRALPPSFWQQPNQPNISPATMYLPPLFKNDIDTNLNEPITDEQQNSSSTQQREREVRISPANTELLFKLFDNVDQNTKDKKQVQLILQSRSTQKTKTISKALIKGEDPCILDAVSEGLFPQLKLESKNEQIQIQNLATAPVSNLPFIEQNYSQALSEIVAAL
ncbi:unnamed protein product [Brachionus calyciflorus]|uniref:Uncharacterized protein n=1 Tax=Brachionus calyciflorus TaxID=104777 RepID=A0A813ME15_9BILA|nr:unnamed protein product [Brachionus calyciflorus]